MCSSRSVSPYTPKSQTKASTFTRAHLSSVYDSVTLAVVIRIARRITLRRRHWQFVTVR